jgi:Ca-activated chloride channel homolog
MLAGGRSQPVSISPSRPPDIFSGIAVVITGRFRGRPDGSVMVSGTGIDGCPWASRAKALPVDGHALTQLWARAFLADLQHKYLRCPIEEAASLEQLIVTTSLRFGVLTRLTAFVAVSNAPTRAPGAPRQIIQSVELPADWTEPAPSLSPYAIEYERILASTHNSPAAEPTASQPIPDLQPARPTAVGTAPMAAGPALSATRILPLPAPPMILPSSPGPMTTQPPQSAPSPPKKTRSRVGRYIGAGAAAIAVAIAVVIGGVTLFEATTSKQSALVEPSTAQPFSSTLGPSAQPPIAAAPTQATFLVCPDGHTGVATSVTSCQFAMNVRDSYLRQGGPTRLIAHSSVTGQTYEMECHAGFTARLSNGMTVDSVRCVGGNGAAVILW